MARKQEPARLVDDGEYKTDGMYRSGGPKDKYSAAELQLQAREVVEDFDKPAIERVRDIRAWLTEVVAPHIDGPHDPQPFIRGDFGSVSHSGWYENVTLSTAAGLYHVNAERGTWIEDCVDALRENKQLEQLLNAGGKPDEIMRLTHRQGLLQQRIEARALFAPFVRIGKRKSFKAHEQAKRTNEKRAARRPNYPAAVKSVMAKRKIAYTPACKVVADQYDVTPKTVRNNTPELRPGRKRK